jgi:7-cyano-7-deazaguanine synthase in queuosine biosynthesis
VSNGENLEAITQKVLHVVEINSDSGCSCAQTVIHARIGSDIKFDPNIFDSYCYDGWSDIHHDLLVLSASVEAADRCWGRSTLRWMREIHVRVPVIKLATWLDETLQRHLISTLRHLTGDKWSFDFYQWEGEATTNKRQRPLFPNENKQFALAYSEGLDSYCVARLFNKYDTAVCVRVAKHKEIPKDGERPFDRLPFEVSVDNAEDSVRSRGFKFAAITAIAAHLSNVSRIIVPESGQGALGTILCPLIGVYPDYRNHPTFFRRMEKFINAVLNANLTYEQPRLWYTKGETIKACLSEGVSSAHIIDTRSCWQQRFNVRVGGSFGQCGICAACLLRRMSLHAANIKEPDTAYSVADLKSKTFAEAVAQRDFVPTSTLPEFGYMGARHLDQLAKLSNTPDNKLRPYVVELATALGETEASIHRQLRQLLSRHSEEWQAFSAAIGEQSFLNTWTIGGRNG